MKAIIILILLATTVMTIKNIDNMNLNHAINQQVENCSLYVGYCD